MPQPQLAWGQFPIHATPQDSSCKLSLKICTVPHTIRYPKSTYSTPLPPLPSVSYLISPDAYAPRTTPPPRKHNGPYPASKTLAFFSLFFSLTHSTTPSKSKAKDKSRGSPHLRAISFCFSLPGCQIRVPLFARGSRVITREWNLGWGFAHPRQG